MTSLEMTSLLLMPVAGLIIGAVALYIVTSHENRRRHHLHPGE
ncbi:hypothetical protein [Neorhizobium sp. DT-125]